MPENITPDANTEATPSAAEPDANAAPVEPSSDAPQTPEKGSETPEPTMADVAREAYEKSQAQQEPEPEPESPVQDPNKTPEPEEVPDPAKEAPDKDKELPFHDHPRFKEVVSQRDEAKTKAEQFEPLAKQQVYHEAFCRQYGITSEEVAQMMNFLALRKQDPLKARDALKPMWDSFSDLDPDRLPKELVDAVANNEISEALAKRLWSAETRSRAGQQTQRFTAQQIAVQQEAAKAEALTTWDMSKRGSDPDFRPKTDATKPDGLWEATAAKFSYLRITNPPATARDEVALLERAYKETKSLFTSLRPAPRTNGKVPTSHKASGRSRSEPKNMDEVVASVAREHGLEWNGRKPLTEND